MHSEQRIGVLLVNTGSPDEPTPRAVRAYLSAMLSDSRLIHNVNMLVWRLVLHLCILPRRGKASAERYRKIWTEEGSPLIISCLRLASELEDRFSEQGLDVIVRAGMTYGNPSIPSRLHELRTAGCTRLIVLPLFPQHAFSTTESVRDRVTRSLKRMNWTPDMDFIDDYHDHDTYVRALAASVKHAGFGASAEDRLVFSFHSVPVPDIEAGDVYELQTGATALAVAGVLGLDRKRWTICYQSKFSRYCEWLTPSTLDVLERYAQAGEGRVFFICPGFATDCLETLYDVFYELKPHFDEKAREAGRTGAEADFTYVPCLGKTNAHVKVLFEVLEPHVARENVVGG